MGMFDTLIVHNVKCPKCNKLIKELGIQFKPYPILEMFKIGDVKRVRGCIECPHCKTLFDTNVLLRIEGHDKLIEWKN